MLTFLRCRLLNLFQPPRSSVLTLSHPFDLIPNPLLRSISFQESLAYRPLQQRVPAECFVSLFNTLANRYAESALHTNKIPGFTPENCASCNGLGTGQDQRLCQPCRGKGRILVIQPAISCPWCVGTGKPESNRVDYCVVCLGTGWVCTEFHVDQSSIRRAASVLIASGRVTPAEGPE